MSQYTRRLAMLWSLFVLMLVASGSDSAHAQNTALKLALDWYPNANHLGLFIAQEKGYFRQENLDVTLYTPVDPSTVLQTVGSGTDAFGISYQPDVLLARAQGCPWSPWPVWYRTLNSVIALKSSGITRPRDLVGKKVGYPAIPTNEPLLGTMLKADGARGLQDIELVNVGFDLVPALISRRVDAVVGAYWTHESILLENQGHPVHIMRVEEWGVPDATSWCWSLTKVRSKINPKSLRASCVLSAEAMRTPPRTPGRRGHPPEGHEGRGGREDRTPWRRITGTAVEDGQDPVRHAGCRQVGELYPVAAGEWTAGQSCQGWGCLHEPLPGW